VDRGDEDRGDEEVSVMALRSGHGTGAGVPRVEVLPCDELPAGAPAQARVASPGDRGEGGRFASGNGLAREGGLARAGKTRLAERLGLASLAAESAFSPYRASAESLRRAQCAELARTVGGGQCGPAPSSLVATAALQLAWSRFLSDQAAEAGSAPLALSASRLANDSRQNLLAAHELCAREAAARPRAPFDPLAGYRLPQDAEASADEPSADDDQDDRVAGEEHAS
jgi:hypothetical protein